MSPPFRAAGSQATRARGRTSFAIGGGAVNPPAACRRGNDSAPLLDRVDLHVEVPALSYEELASAAPGEATAAVRARVERARHVQRARLREAGLHCNAQMGAREVRAHCGHDEACARLLEGAMRALGLSARGYARVLKVARTIADLAGEPRSFPK